MNTPGKHCTSSQLSDSQEFLLGDCKVLEFTLIVSKRIAALLGTAFNLLSDCKANNLLPTAPKIKKEANGAPQKSWSKQTREK